ncbi:MAG: hypothetical protein IPQ07_16820 [Myxococcales bacterium]|nr:hypothetical protein [Myxococcales bacterium]
MTKTILVAALALAACGGASKPVTTSTTSSAPPAAAKGVVIVDDIDCPKLVNHMVDIHAAANPEKTAANPDAIAQIRVDTIKECEQKWGASPPTDADKAAARCSMKAATTGELEACGS